MANKVRAAGQHAWRHLHDARIRSMKRERDERKDLAALPPVSCCQRELKAQRQALEAEKQQVQRELAAQQQALEAARAAAAAQAAAAAAAAAQEAQPSKLALQVGGWLAVRQNYCDRMIATICLREWGAGLAGWPAWRVGRVFGSWIVGCSKKPAFCTAPACRALWPCWRPGVCRAG